MGTPESLATPLQVNQDYFYFCTLKVSALSLSRHGSSFEFYVTKPFDEKICLSQFLLVSVSGQNAWLFLLHQENSESIFLFFTAEFWAGVVAFHGLENHYSWTVLHLVKCSCFIYLLFVFKEKKKHREAEQVQASGTAPSRPTTRMDQEGADRRRETVRRSVQKHREKQSSQKKWRVNEKRMAYYYRVKAERKAVHQANTEKSVQVEMAFQSSCSSSPCPTQQAFRRAVARVREKFKAGGKKFAFLFKGFIKSADSETKQALKELNVTCTTPKKTTTGSLQQHLAEIKCKRDKKTLEHKRRLAEAFKQSESFSKRYVKSTQKSPVYSRKNLPMLQADIRDFYYQNAVEDPCKSSKRSQLTKSVKELHNDFLKKSRFNVSLRSFHCHKPKDIKSVRKMKFRQCLCEICLNPKLKVSRLNSLAHKSESVRELLKESMCGFEGVPHLLCVDRKCCECGIACVMRRLKEEFGELVQKKVSWSRWEAVKQGKTSCVEKVKKI